MSPSVRVAVVGAGWWSSSHHLPALVAHPGAELVGVADSDSARAARVAASYGVPAFSSLDDVVAAGRAEAAVIATPHATHHALTRQALTQGLHVLVEKPLALTSGDAFDLMRLAESRRRHLSVGYTHQYEDVADAVRAAVHADIGELVQVTVEYSSRAGRLFAAAEAGAASTTVDVPPGQPHPEAYSAANGGGQAHTQLTHALGMLCWTTGRELSDVAAFTDHRGFEVDVSDVAAFTLSGGATGVAVATGATPAGVPVRQHIRYAGTEGTVSHDLFRTEAHVHRTDGATRAVRHDQHQAPYRAGEPARAFIDLVHGDGPNRGPARPAAAAVAAVEAILESARRGTPVRVAQLPPL
ncbi:Gfo/Idh/MocA family oxidoreductase [Phytoactinopolyspora alkaliphila]|uniref:Gfo/Idh/MocA family oxidoreductase n=1 Tax=Phytoactinopolyspora alkaliphila TaxID=1783498 RepID=A0A6N9YK46_9ACTN|nr:Gfo/Idh/MocA family oxidoreductase [Phytoactinopolyspora alkaliphila]NED95373.1 Gfo/Idh/MocA family oxidoreductase [Phytoactinopolyspora alkaliphila]